MSVVQVRLNSRNVVKLLRSSAVEADLARRAKNIASAAGAGMESDSDTGRTRARAWAWTDTPQAMRAEATGRALTRAIDAGRD